MQAMADGEGEELERASPGAGGVVQEMEQAALRCAGVPPVGGGHGVGERRGGLACGGGGRHRQERETIRLRLDFFSFVFENGFGWI